MKNDSSPTTEEILRRSEAVEAAVRASVREALIQHKQMGHPIVVWKDGQVCWIPAKEIEIPPEEPTE